MAKKKSKWNSEKWLSISAMMISFITLFIFVYQTNLMRKQNYLSILPYLIISTTHNSEDSQYELNILNHGVGPAIIESVHLLYQEERYNLVDYNNDIHEFLKSKAPALDSLKYWSTSTLDKGMAIPANTKFHVLGVNGSVPDFKLLTTTLQQLSDEGLDYELVYKSIEGERWRINSQSDEPVRLH